MGKYSSSDSDYSRSSSSSKKRKKKSRKRKSLSPSRHSSKKLRRRSRSRSPSSDRSNSAHRRKRSRSRDRHRHSARRSRSRTRSPIYHRKSRDRSPEKSSRRKKRSRDRSASPPSRRGGKHVDAVMGLSTGTLKDVMDIVPGFSKMNPAEQSRIRIQRALKVAVETAKEEQKDDVTVQKDEEMNTKTQIERTKEIEQIEGNSDSDENEIGFIPSHFKSSNKIKKRANESVKKSFNEMENTHEMAIFGHVSMLTLEEAMKRKKLADDEAMLKAKKRIDFTERDPRTLVAPELLISREDADKRWIRKLTSLRQRFMT